MDRKATHSFAELEVSPSTYAEVRGKLAAAKYDHAFVDHQTIDMSGVGLKLEGPRMWTLCEAQQLVGRLSGALRGAGWDVSVGGDVAERGWSDERLELTLLPRPLHPTIPVSDDAERVFGGDGAAHHSATSEWRRYVAAVYYGYKRVELTFVFVDPTREQHLATFVCIEI